MSVNASSVALLTGVPGSGVEPVHASTAFFEFVHRLHLFDERAVDIVEHE